MRAHGVRDNVHGSALHNAVIHAGSALPSFPSGAIQLLVGPASSFFSAADESSVFYSCYVVRQRSVVQTAGVLFLIELYHLAGSDSFFCECVSLLFFAIDPYYLVRLGESDHFVIDARTFLLFVNAIGNTS